MTTINALKFDRFSGVMVCDEQRHWNPERLKIYAADKIRSVIPPEIRERYGLAAAYGNTGTSGIGDELRLTIYREVEAEFQRRCREEKRVPDTFLDIEGVARLAWRVICRMKHTHVDDYLANRYGFTTRELIQEKTVRENGEYPVKNEAVVREALDSIARPANATTADAVFGNGGILAGFDPENGFRIYTYSMKEGFYEESEAGYSALGSGGDTTNFILPRLFNEAGVTGRENGISPVTGVAAALDAVNMASEHNLGVGGYFNIILFNRNGAARSAEYREINDHRSKLASEVVRAARARFISIATRDRILQGLLFDDRSMEWGETELWKSSNDPLKLHRLLRGYPVQSDC